jgi:two-component system chemotaxis response regulator CheY
MAVKVLVVDDSAVARRVVIKTLEMSGAAISGIVQAADGAQGLAAVARENPDLVITDLNMPVMDGIEMLGRLREAPETAELPVIVVSTEGSETRLAQVCAAHAAFVRKPFTPEQLVRAVIAAIKGGSHAGLEPEVVPRSGPDF